MTAIQVDGLRKSYADFEAVKGISFEVAEGEIFALLGRNGAGKTTTIEVLSGFQKPDAGTVRVLGLDPVKDRNELRRNTGVMLQEAGFFPDLTVAQTVDAWRDFTAAARPRDEAIELTGLTAKAATRVRQLSGGEKRRLDLALALLGRPDLLFLDEPTTGMDPEARMSTWEVVRGLAAQGTTILLTTHYLEEAQRLADTMAIMDAGVIVAAGSMAEALSGQAGRITFELPDGITPEELPIPASATEGRTVICRVPEPDVAAQRLLGWAGERGLRVRGLDVHAATLEDLFLGLTSHDKQERDKQDKEVA